MFRKTFVYLLLLSLVFQCLGSLGLLTWFIVNREYITNELCENKERPMMHCNGQCVLMKKLKKWGEAESQDSERYINKIEALVIVPETLKLKAPIPTLRQWIVPPYSGRYYYLYATSLFHPPRMI
ncbi:hypothetical protein M1D52_10010 [Olivibacter sp. SA151]|uniref:Uncharacterized protein n=1 Tax=Sphingobacterium sp. (strain 21) TaxID=743722 RepID=F4C7I1_SPHS2